MVWKNVKESRRNFVESWEAKSDASKWRSNRLNERSQTKYSRRIPRPPLLWPVFKLRKLPPPPSSIPSILLPLTEYLTFCFHRQGSNFFLFRIWFPWLNPDHVLSQREEWGGWDYKFLFFSRDECNLWSFFSLLVTYWRFFHLFFSPFISLMLSHVSQTVSVSFSLSRKMEWMVKVTENKELVVSREGRKYLSWGESWQVLLVLYNLLRARIKSCPCITSFTITFTFSTIK